MNLLAPFRIALRALAANTLRSILTMLAIIIGVAAVITMIAVGRGGYLGGRAVCRLAGQHDGELHPAGSGLFGLCWHLLWFLPSAAGLPAAADRGPAL